MKILIQISPIPGTCTVLINRKKSCQPKQKTRRKLHSKVFERIKESKWGISCKYMWIKDPWNTSELERTLFSVQSATNNIQIKIIHRVVGDGCIWEGLSLINACWVSQSVFYEVLNAVGDDVFQRKCLFNGEIMLHSAFNKDTEKVVLLEVKGLIQIIVKFRAEKILRMFLSPNILLRDMKYRLWKQFCSFENERLISFSCIIWVMISKKNITRCTFLHRGACVHQKSQQGIKKFFQPLNYLYVG